MEEMSNMAEGMVTMLNREKFAKEIMDLALKHTTVAITADGKICGCRDISCFDCKFYKPGNCRTAFKGWLNSEYAEPKIDWENVPEDTPVWVRNDRNTTPQKRHFKRVNPNANFLAYETFPDGKTSWTNNRDTAEHWVCCELAQEEDKKKYAKGTEY